MTRINSYLWQLPHSPEADDPPDVAALQAAFNAPLADQLGPALAGAGYVLTTSDIHIPPDQVVTFAEMDDTFRANVRFIKYLQPDVLARIHFEHEEWSLGLASTTPHSFFINLDRFRLADTRTQLVDKTWEGRLHLRLSSLEGPTLEHSGLDQRWVYQTPEGFSDLIARFWAKFGAGGQTLLEGG